MKVILLQTKAIKAQKKQQALTLNIFNISGY